MHDSNWLNWFFICKQDLSCRHSFSDNTASWIQQHVNNFALICKTWYKSNVKYEIGFIPIRFIFYVLYNASNDKFHTILKYADKIFVHLLQKWAKIKPLSNPGRNIETWKRFPNIKIVNSFSPIFAADIKGKHFTSRVCWCLMG